jgi:hypothetical protein
MNLRYYTNRLGLSQKWTLLDHYTIWIFFRTIIPSEYDYPKNCIPRKIIILVITSSHRATETWLTLSKYNNDAGTIHESWNDSLFVSVWKFKLSFPSKKLNLQSRGSLLCDTCSPTRHPLSWMMPHHLPLSMMPHGSGSYMMKLSVSHKRIWFYDESVFSTDGRWRFFTNLSCMVVQTWHSIFYVLNFIGNSYKTSFVMNWTFIMMKLVHQITGQLFSLANPVVPWTFDGIR